eukprot:221912_1
MALLRAQFESRRTKQCKCIAIVLFIILPCMLQYLAVTTDYIWKGASQTQIMTERTLDTSTTSKKQQHIIRIHNRSMKKTHCNLSQHWNETQRLIRRLTICIGVQKSGTSSLQQLIKQATDVVQFRQGKPMSELHYFDFFVMKVSRQALNSFDKAIHYYDYGCLSNQGYMQNLIGKQSHSSYFFEKTPIYVLYPHIAYIMAHDMIQYGTKVILLLRNPVHRFVSGYFQELSLSKHNRLPSDWNRSLDVYLEDVISTFAEYISDLERMCSNVNGSTVSDMVRRYTELVYFYSRMRDVLKRFYFVWIRSCYGPQIITWLYYIGMATESKHSMKVVQSEVYFKDTEETTNHILCYIHYDVGDANYSEWMSECVKENRYYHAQGSVNPEAKNSQRRTSFALSEQQRQRLSSSFDICNKWLRVILDSAQYVDLMMLPFNWSLWN